MAKPVGGIIANDDVAIKIGELLCEALYGDLSKQKPLTAIDKSNLWRIEGSRNRGGTEEGAAQFFLSIDKSDGRVRGVGETMLLNPHPSVVSILDKYLATGSDDQFEDDRSSSDACMLLLNSLGRGGLIFSADLAAKIGEVLCEAHYGDLSRQMPLSVTDKETYWRVEGDWNRDGNLDGPGPFYISIEKDDGRIAEIGE